MLQYSFIRNSHNWCHVKYSENCQKSSKARVFTIFVIIMCTYVVVIGVRVHLGMAFIKINSIKCKLCKYLLTKTWKTSFLCFFHWKVQAGSQWTPVPSTFDGTPWPRWRWYLWFFFAKMTAKDDLTTTYKRLVKYLDVLVQSTPPPLVRRGLNLNSITFCQILFQKIENAYNYVLLLWVNFYSKVVLESGLSLFLNRISNISRRIRHFKKVDDESFREKFQENGFLR